MKRLNKKHKAYLRCLLLKIWSHQALDWYIENPNDNEFSEVYGFSADDSSEVWDIFISRIKKNKII